LTRVEGQTLFFRNGIKPSVSQGGETLSVEVPADRLPSGTSVLTLTGIAANGAAEEVGKYVIRIQPR